MAAPAPAAAAYDPNELRVTFFHMLRGDAALIQCPTALVDGRAHRTTLLVDCGSHSDISGEVFDLAAATLHKACATQPLDALILTHTDRDHHSKVAQLFPAVDSDLMVDGDEATTKYPAVAINALYFSDYQYARRYRADPATGAAYLNANSPLAQYTAEGTNEYLYEEMLGKPITLVNIDGLDNHVVRWDELAAKAPYPHEKHDLPNAYLTIAQGTTNGIAWSVKLLAGNAPDPRARTGEGPRAINAASIVTLVTFGADTLLICGDATDGTEAMISADPTKRAWIQGLSVLQAPHHGSDGSSSAAFVQATNPSVVVESVAAEEHRYRLPKRSVLDRYLTPGADRRLEQHAEPHPITGWVALGVLGGGNAAYGVIAGWEKAFGKRLVSPYALDESELAKVMGATEDAWTAVEADSSRGGFVLYRQSSTREIWQTGMNGAEEFLTWGFNGT